MLTYIAVSAKDKASPRTGEELLRPRSASLPLNTRFVPIFVCRVVEILGPMRGDGPP